MVVWHFKQIGKVKKLNKWLPHELIKNKKSNCFEVSSLILGEGHGTPLQYSCLENPMDGGAWWAAVHGVTKSQTQLSD